MDVGRCALMCVLPSELTISGVAFFMYLLVVDLLGYFRVKRGQMYSSHIKRNLRLAMTTNRPTGANLTNIYLTHD